jgi:hypothetical protein
MRLLIKGLKLLRCKVFGHGRTVMRTMWHDGVTQVSEPVCLRCGEPTIK